MVNGWRSMGAGVVIGAISVMIAIQGVLLIASDDPVGAIPMAAVLGVSGHRLIAGWIMILALPVAVITLASSQTLPRLARIVCLAPQLTVSLIYGWGAISAIIAGHYADGVVRPSSFILADQLGLIILMTLHSAAVAEIVVHKCGAISQTS
jgi:hypothetical protein